LGELKFSETTIQHILLYLLIREINQVYGTITLYFESRELSSSVTSLSTRWRVIDLFTLLIIFTCLFGLDLSKTELLLFLLQFVYVCKNGNFNVKLGDTVKFIGGESDEVII